MMENVLIVLPAEWKIKSLRYLQGPVPGPVILDVDKIPTPIDDGWSWLNYKTRPVKKARDEPTS